MEEKNESKTRLDVLRGSRKKKQERLTAAVHGYFADVASANGQPLNDKRNGRATMERWERKNEAVRTANAELEKTERAIEREEAKVARVEATKDKLPAFILEALASGEISQWRRHPNTFFVVGVDKGRIVVDLETGGIGHRYLSEVPKEQYPRFRDVVNKLLAAHRAQRSVG